MIPISSLDRPARVSLLATFLTEELYILWTLEFAKRKQNISSKCSAVRKLET